MPSSSTLGLKTAFLSKNAIFSPNIELEGIARQVVEASRLGICACFGNWGRNRGGYNFQFFSWLTLMHIFAVHIVLAYWHLQRDMVVRRCLPKKLNVLLWAHKRKFDHIYMGGILSWRSKSLFYTLLRHILKKKSNFYAWLGVVRPWWWGVWWGAGGRGGKYLHVHSNHDRAAHTTVFITICS